jgi:hypothetical protein
MHMLCLARLGNVMPTYVCSSWPGIPCADAFARCGTMHQMRLDPMEAAPLNWAAVHLPWHHHHTGRWSEQGMFVSGTPPKALPWRPAELLGVATHVLPPRAAIISLCGLQPRHVLHSMLGVHAQLVAWLQSAVSCPTPTRTTKFGRHLLLLRWDWQASASQGRLVPNAMLPPCLQVVYVLVSMAQC